GQASGVKEEFGRCFGRAPGPPPLAVGTLRMCLSDILFNFTTGQRSVFSDHLIDLIEEAGAFGFESVRIHPGPPSSVPSQQWECRGRNVGGFMGPGFQHAARGPTGGTVQQSGVVWAESSKQWEQVGSCDDVDRIDL